MTRIELAAELNHAAACLLVAGQSIPERAHDLRDLAVCLQLMAMDLEHIPESDGSAAPLLPIGRCGCGSDAQAEWHRRSAGLRA